MDDSYQLIFVSNSGYPIVCVAMLAVWFLFGVMYKIETVHNLGSALILNPLLPLEHFSGWSFSRTSWTKIPLL